MDQLLFWLVPAASVLALCFAWYFHRQMMKESEGTPQMVKIAAAVRKGAMSYLRQQYKIVGWVFLGLVILFSIMAYGFGVQNSWVPIAFLTGGFFSGLSGFLGSPCKSAKGQPASRSSPQSPSETTTRPNVWPDGNNRHPASSCFQSISSEIFSVSLTWLPCGCE